MARVTMRWPRAGGVGDDARGAGEAEAASEGPDVPIDGDDDEAAVDVDVAESDGDRGEAAATSEGPGEPPDEGGDEAGPALDAAESVGFCPQLPK